MKRRFILYRRKRGGIFYVEDTVARKQESLGTRERGEALAMVNARNEAIRRPHLNLQIAKAYLAGTDSAASTRTWQHALDALIETKHGPTMDRWRRAAKESALDLIRDRVIIETQAEPLLAALKAGTVSTNVHLRKLHNFCLSMNWLPWPIIPKRFGRRCAFSRKEQLPSRNISSSLSAKRTRNAATSTSCVGISADRKPTSPTLQPKTLTGPVIPLPTPGRRPEASPCSASARRSERSCADCQVVVHY